MMSHEKPRKRVQILSQRRLSASQRIDPRWAVTSPLKKSFDQQAAMTVVIVLLAAAIHGGCGKRTDSPATSGESGKETFKTQSDVKSGDISTAGPTPKIDTSLRDVPGLGESDFFKPLASVIVKADPARDPAWQSEQFSNAASHQLQALGKLLAHSQQSSTVDSAKLKEDFAKLAGNEFTCGPLRMELREVFRDRMLIVWRQEKDAAEKKTSATLFEGPQGLAAAALALAAPLSMGADYDIHVKFKIIRVELEQAGASTIVYYEASGKTLDGIVQQTATWHCRWTNAKTDEPPQLVSIRVENFEEIRPQHKSGPLFVDCTEAVLAHNDSYSKQLVYGADHWYGNFEVSFGIHQGNQGISIGDANGDGRDDILVCQPSGLPSRLYQQQADGTLLDVTRRSGLDFLDVARSALFVDLDNDGDQDLAISLAYSVVIFENDGSGRFQAQRRIDVFSWPSSVVAVDYDLDGDLDLYICGYNPRADAAPEDIFANPVPYHDANNGARNFMIRNDGNWNFLDVTAEVGLSMNNRRFSFAAAWEDYDNDGDADLYVANDFGRNNLYRNDRDSTGKVHFVDVAAEAGVEDIAAGMSVSWNDYNHDGLMDLYVSNMFSSAGNRIAYQRRFKSTEDDATRAQLQRHARGNTLFENTGNGTFRDVSAVAGVTMGRWAWGSLFADINNDGWDDLYVTNGFFTTEDSGDL